MILKNVFLQVIFVKIKFGGWGGGNIRVLINSYYVLIFDIEKKIEYFKSFYIINQKNMLKRYNFLILIFFGFLLFICNRFYMEVEFGYG